MWHDRKTLRRYARASLLATALPLLIGCGVSSAGDQPVNPLLPASGAIAGRWSFLGDTALSSAGTPTGTLLGTAQFHGALQTNGTAVAGNGQVLALPAVFPTACMRQDAATLSGTFTSARHLSLVSDGKNGSTLHMELDVASDPHTVSQGTASMSGLCSLPVFNVTAALYDSVNGAYAAASVQQLDTSAQTLTTLPGASASATMTESAQDSDGRSTLSGTVKLTLPACSLTLPVSVTRVGGVLWDFGTTAFPQPTPRVTLTSTPEATQVSVLIVGLGIDCKAQDPLSTKPNAYSARLTRQ